MSETTSSRLLELLSLLQARRDWPGSELADRLEVSRRTVRRDIERLRNLGYPVESLSGPAGGYRLRAGTAMPPLLLDEEEAIAIAVGLRTAAQASVAGIEEMSVRALVKLEQVLPAHLRRRVSAARRRDRDAARWRPDGRSAVPDPDRLGLPRPRADPLRLPRPRRPRIRRLRRAAFTGQLRPPLVPRRLGPRARGLADVPGRQDLGSGRGRRAVRAAVPAGRRRPRHLRRRGPAGRDLRPTRRGSSSAARPRSCSAGRAYGAASSRSTRTPASTGPATTTSTGWRCGSRCCPGTSRSPSRRSSSGACARSETGSGAPSALSPRPRTCRRARRRSRRASPPHGPAQRWRSGRSAPGGGGRSRRAGCRSTRPRR